MSRHRISSGSSFEKEIGYSRAVEEDGWIFVSGTTGFDYRTMRIEHDVVAQCEQCFKNIAEALSQCGAGLSDVVRVLYILQRREDFGRCTPVLRKHFAHARPAATMIVAGMLEERILIEVEVTARKPPQSEG
jgi:enamine deaminase RidA (YjgF/YER057c/UK114 family)